MTDTHDLQFALEAAGYTTPLAEALAERGVTVDEAKSLSRRDMMEHYLEWNGICGYTGEILCVLDNLTQRKHH